MRVSIVSLSLYLGLLVVAVFSQGCGPGDPEETPNGYAIFKVAERDGVIYGGGAFRQPKNAAGNQLLGHELLLILDASDPASPNVVEARDIGISKLVDVMGDKLVLFQDGYDETQLGVSSPLPEQDFRVKVYSLADPSDPQLERTITIPGSMGYDYPVATRLDDDRVLISIFFPGVEDAGAPALSWLVSLSAPSGAEIVGTSPKGCSAPVLKGSRVWCFNAGGEVNDVIRAFEIAPSGALSVVEEILTPQLNAAGNSALLSDGAIALTDSTRGISRVSFNAGGQPSIANTLDLDHSEQSVAAGPAASVIAQTQEKIYLLSSSLGVLSTLDYPGLPYRDHSGGSEVRPFGDASSGLYAAALGDYGIMIFSASGGTLVKIGGYYRRFGTNWASEDQLQEGNY